MKGFTLWEPWASLVAHGYKTIETRSWPTSYRGPLAIHAAKTGKHCGALPVLFKEAGIDDDGLAVFCEAVPDWPLGKIVAVCEVTDCVRIDEAFAGGLTPKERAFGNYTPGRYAWVLGKIRRVDPPLAFKGMQGLWSVPKETAEEIYGRLR